jgi:phosphoribosylformylglycinamidine synthase subunit PurL
MTSDLNAKLKHYRISQSEYEMIKKHLGHEPNDIEWAVYSALWSEHCSYKSSKVHLRKLFTKHPRVVQGPGENAGVIDLGQGERVAFKMESHNHPSFIEPTQGAATGVGGILRDIFTMGARPMASMDYLCFGEAGHQNSPRLINGVVKGVGGYGNCVGVPTVSGQTTFHKSYNNNNLVNAFSLGLFRPGEDIFYGRAEGPGNLVVYMGARTGRDGIHGAAMASESFDEDSEKKKPNIQIGDPFFEKLLIEACLEVMKQKLVVGIQDMGAAGLTSSTFEMASRAKCGLKLDLKKVPLREPDITPEEILLSESQERMVLVVEPAKFKAVEAICNRWDLSCSVIGEITHGDKVELYWGDEKLCSISHEPLVEEAPVYERPFEIPQPAPRKKIEAVNPRMWNETFLAFIASPSMTSREWITNQYDQRVGAKTVSACEDGVALLRLPDSGRVIAMATGCRPLLMEWDVELGAKDAVALPVLQLASRGARALAATDCLNFGNPERRAVMGQFVAAMQGMDQACRAFDVPIISGNVSLYNETLGENIVPTPAMGIVGLREDVHVPKAVLTEEGLILYHLRSPNETTWLGEYATFAGMKPHGTAQINFPELIALQGVYLRLAEFAAASSVIGRGGLAAALVKLSRDGIGIEIAENFTKSVPGRNEIEVLFAERFYSSVFAVRPGDAKRLEALSSEGGVVAEEIGRSKRGLFKVGNLIDLKLDEVLKAYNTGLRGIVEKLA